MRYHEEAMKNNWYVFNNGLKYSRGFPKIMRGDYRSPGHAWDIFARFAGEFFEKKVVL